MKKSGFLIIWVLCLSLGVLAQEFVSVAEGIEYAKFNRQLKNETTSVNLLRLDLSKVRLDVFHALDTAIGLETTSSMALRHNAIAAINGGFFKMDGLYRGDSAGVLQIDGKILSESYQNRASLVINNNSEATSIIFGRIKTIQEVFLKKGSFEVNGINRQRKANEIIIYTPDFHRTTLTDKEGIEIIVRKNKISQVVVDKGSSLIPADGFVVSFGRERADEMKKKGLPKIGEKYAFFGGSAEVLNSSEKIKLEKEDIVGGMPFLISDGRIRISWEEEKIGKEFVETRHPRTAVAKLKDGKALLVTVDGRSTQSVGMSLPELAEMLFELGAVEALNLDGGGSTTMVVKDKVVNSPSDKTGERPVSDAILIFPRKIK